MSEWVDIIVYAALIVGVWGWFPAWSSRLTVPLIADRNPGWLADHPESERRLVARHWFRWSCLLWGSVSLLTLLAFQLDVRPQQLAFLPAAPKWEALKDLNSTLFIAGLSYVAACAVGFFRWLDTNVPLSSRRQATLERRSLHDYVPRPLQYAVYAVIVLHLAVWAVVGVTGRYATAVFWGGMAFQFVISGVFLLFVLTAVRRRPGAMDRIFGPGYRRTEVRAAFAAQLLPLPNGIARLYEQVASTSSDNLDRFMHLGLVLLVVALAMTLAAWARQPAAPGSAHWRRSATSAGVLAFVLSMTMIQGAAQELPHAVSDDEMRKLLVERVDTYRHSLGIVVGIVEPTGRRVIAYGKRSKEDGTPVDGDTVFELASVTKAFTSLLLADAVTRGEVALSDPVAKYLPPSVRMPERRGRSITLHDLATHTSGLPREPSNLQPNDLSNPFADYSVEQLYQFLSGHQLTRDISSEFDYSNLGAGLLGHILARRAGTDYETLVHTRITGPLGMSSTGITLSPAVYARLAVGHNRFLEPAPNWDSPTLAGAGALRSTVNDMLTFLAAAIDVERSSLGLAFALTTSARRSPSPAFDVGLGWGIAKNRGTEIMFVNGRSGGYRTWLGYEPRTRRGVVVLTNADGVIGPDDLGRHLLNPAFPLLQNVPSAPAPRRETRVDPAVLDRYVGRYQLAPAVILEVGRQGNRFFSQFTGEPPFELFAGSEKVYFLKTADAQLTFETDAAGKATTVELRLNGAAQRAPRIEGTPVMPQEIAIDPAVLERYVGRYEFAPNIVLAISRKDARMFAQLTGQPSIEIFASSQRQFFYKVVSAQLSFETSDDGRVLAVVLHQNGVDQRARRID